MVKIIKYKILYLTIGLMTTVGVALSSDFISGFCGETESDHKDSISLMEAVGYDMAYMFAYSMRKVKWNECVLFELLCSSCSNVYLHMVCNRLESIIFGSNFLHTCDKSDFRVYSNSGLCYSFSLK